MLLSLLGLDMTKQMTLPMMYYLQTWWGRNQKCHHSHILPNSVLFGNKALADLHIKCLTNVMKVCLHEKILPITTLKPLSWIVNNTDHLLGSWHLFECQMTQTFNLCYIYPETTDDTASWIEVGRFQVRCFTNECLCNYKMIKTFWGAVADCHYFKQAAFSSASLSATLS